MFTNYRYICVFTCHIKIILKKVLYIEIGFICFVKPMSSPLSFALAQCNNNGVHKYLGSEIILHV